jgi:prephenate dehydrogenase
VRERSQDERMENVTIIGVGLIGASFGLALKHAGFQGRITGVSSKPALDAALERGAIDRGLPLEEAVREADLIYLAQPIHRILETIPKLNALVKPSALVTDAGSTKAGIVARARETLNRAQFLGGHPMAGKETRGAAEAEPGLFAGRTWVLTPSAPEELETPPARELIEWIRAIGAVPVVLPPGRHDRVVAYTSHLPQLMATTLATTLAAEPAVCECLEASGPALAGALRLAASSYEIWGDILDTNGAAIAEALTACIARLEAMREGLGTTHPAREFELANAFAERLRR